MLGINAVCCHTIQLLHERKLQRPLVASPSICQAADTASMAATAAKFSYLRSCGKGPKYTWAYIYDKVR